MSLSASTREACEVFAAVYGQEPHAPMQGEMEAEGIADMTAWRDVVRQCRGNGTPWRNAGTILKMYREEAARRAARVSRAKARASPVADAGDGWKPRDLTPELLAEIEGCTVEQAREALRR